MTVPDSGSIVTTPEPATLRVSPVEFYLTARDLCNGADLLRKHSTPSLRVVASLYCQTVESALKAYLIARGKTPRQVKRWRHDLNRLLTETAALGIYDLIVITHEEGTLLMSTAKKYARNRLAYFDDITDLWICPGVQRPDLDALASLARKLVSGIERGCLDAATGDWRPF
jgi:hypothetical protein